MNCRSSIGGDTINQYSASEIVTHIYNALNIYLAPVTGDVTVEQGGTITHPVTSSAASAIILYVGGTAAIMSGGQINTDQRSSYLRGCPDWGNSGALYPSHGGRGYDGYVGSSNDV